MTHFVRRSDRRRFTENVSHVFDLLSHSQTEFGVLSISLGRMSARGGQTKVKIQRANGREVIVTPQQAQQKQEIRLVCLDQHATMLRVARKLRDLGIPISFEECRDD